MERKLQKLHSDVFDLYQEMIKTMNWCVNQLRQKDNYSSKEYCADMAFAMDQLDKLVHDVGVEVRKVKDMAVRATCKQWVMEQAQTQDSEPVRTFHVTATPDIKMQPKMPRKGTPEMAELLNWLGLPPENHDVVRIHWPTLCDLVTKRVADGKPLPPWLDSSKMHNPSAALRFHKKHDVTENANTEQQA